MLYFPLIKYCPPRWQKVLVFSLAGIGIVFDSLFPNPLCHYLALLPVWWFGVEMAKEFLASGAITLRGQLPYLLLLCIPLLQFIYISLQWHFLGKPIAFIAYPLVDARYFLSTLILFFMAFIWRRFDFFWYKFMSRPFIFIGTFSYALYVFHYPIILHLRLFSDPSIFYFDLFVVYFFAFCWLLLLNGTFKSGLIVYLIIGLLSRALSIETSSFFYCMRSFWRIGRHLRLVCGLRACQRT
jgi:hypothetical protein